MIQFIIFLIKQSFSFNIKINPNKSTNYSNEGYYSVTLHDSDSISVDLILHSLFFFIPENSYIKLSTLSIDSRIITIPNEFKGGISISGKKIAILEFSSTTTNAETQANFWILPKKMCDCSSVYFYGKSKFFFYTNEVDKLCVFSPSFDSKDCKFDVEFGIYNDYISHLSHLYTDNFNTPDEVNKGDEVKSYQINKAFFVYYDRQLYSSNTSLLNSNEYHRFVFNRKTKLTSDKSYRKKNCDAIDVYKCSNFNCYMDGVSSFNSKCTRFDWITILGLASLGFFGVWLLCAFVYGIYFLAKKYAQKKDNNLNILLSNNSENNMLTSLYTEN